MYLHMTQNKTILTAAMYTLGSCHLCWGYKPGN